MKVTSFLAVIAVACLLLAGAVMAAPALAGKPADNDAGAVKVAWHLSADVMPVPPYGSVDIPGSDVASKLIVNQPNGKTQVAMTGVMNGLNPNTEYTVFISNGYTPYVNSDVTGSYVINVEWLGTDYPENLILTQTGTAITGTSLSLVNPPGASLFTITGGSVIGNAVTIEMNFGGQDTVMQGTIAADGSMSGTWHDTNGMMRTGTWETTSGHALVVSSGSTGWPGLFTSTVQPFTFMTDEFGAGSWHVNLKGLTTGNLLHVRLDQRWRDPPHKRHVRGECEINPFIFLFFNFYFNIFNIIARIPFFYKHMPHFCLS